MQNVSMVRDTDMSREDEWVAFETSTQQSEKLGLALKALTDRQRESDLFKIQPKYVVWRKLVIY